MTRFTEDADSPEYGLIILAVSTIGIILGIFIFKIILKCLNKDFGYKTDIIGGIIGCIITNAILFSYLHFT